MTAQSCIVHYKPGKAMFVLMRKVTSHAAPKLLYVQSCRISSLNGVSHCCGCWHRVDCASISALHIDSIPLTDSYITCDNFLM